MSSTCSSRSCGAGSRYWRGPMARPTKLTPEVQERFLAAVRHGHFRHAAARAARAPAVGVQAMRTWCRQGKKATAGRYREFWHALLQAEAEAESHCVALVLEAAKTDAKHAQWWLERKLPAKWGRNTDFISRLKKFMREMEERWGTPEERGRLEAKIARQRADDLARHESSLARARAMLDSRGGGARVETDLSHLTDEELEELVRLSDKAAEPEPWQLPAG